MNQRILIAIATALIAALAWVEPLYLPMIALGPLLSGIVAGSLGAAPRQVAVPWLVAGLIILILDLAINGEDVGFHAGVAVVTAAVAAAAAAAVRALRRGRTAAA